MTKSAMLALVLFASCALLAGCGNRESDKQPGEAVETTSETVTQKSIPDPRGTYVDVEGGLAFTFLSTGKFYQELLGETSFGQWDRVGDEAKVTFEDGSSMDVELGDGYVEYNGLRLNKR